MEDSIPEHIRCGFLCAVLSLDSADNDECLAFGTRFHIFGDRCGVRLKSQCGVSLSPIGSDGKFEGSDRENVKDSRSKTKKKGIVGLVNGSRSVVRQIQALVDRKCIKIIARLIRVSVNEAGEKRVVLLIDVYLPMALWSGWQFPKSGSMAAALFTHLRCEWGERRNMHITNDLKSKDFHLDHDSIWNTSDCHVLACRIHCSVHDASRKNLFELHEIFKGLNSVANLRLPVYTRVNAADGSCTSGIWELTDDVLVAILTALGPKDLVRASATCRHLRSLAASIMPCMKLKLFPHQQVAIDWMLKRERKDEVLPHPLYRGFSTEDGFAFYINIVSGEIVTGEAPVIKDFRGGMFCDEPGLGKTITALSLILKTQGTLADAPDGAQVIWCTGNGNQKCGYYELTGNKHSNGSIVSCGKRSEKLFVNKFSVVEDLKVPSMNSAKPRSPVLGTSDSGVSSPAVCSVPARCVVRCTQSLSRIKRNLLDGYGEAYPSTDKGLLKKKSTKRRRGSDCPGNTFLDKRVGISCRSLESCKNKKVTKGLYECSETWVQCDGCRKWRNLADRGMADSSAAWFCSMNNDPLYQSCDVPEESWDYRQPITYLPGFCKKGASGGGEQNVSFFTGVLKEHYSLITPETKKALNWLAKLPPQKLVEMETTGLIHPALDTRLVSSGKSNGFSKIFQAFGLIRRVDRDITRWYYPGNLDDLDFDTAALSTALCQPLDSYRIYLSRATLVVVPANLIDHWRTQIEKHVRPGQLQVYVWTDNKKPAAHNLAWDYDVVLTTFNRLSSEWGPRKRSALMQVHWLRVVLDEGHTLGSSVSMTNKLQMAISLMASNRWLLTGTPTPNTPNSQLSQIQPMLKFLHEEVYGMNQKLWDAGILKPFEAEMEEGRSRLMQLLRRCMISARKADLQTIPPCIKKATYLDFTEEHARSYNELVVTVRRNILMADWNDPSHVESLLNPKQWKFRSTTIRNVRLSCCVAGHIKVAEAGQDIQDTMDILVENGLDPNSEEYLFIKYNLLFGGNCLRCKEWCRLPVITPCRHLLCLGCVALDSERCTFHGCGNMYEMQSPEILTRPENQNPKWPDDWDPDWQSTSSSKVNYLIERLKAIQEANRKICYSIHEYIEGELPEELPSSSRANWNGILHQKAYVQQNNESYKLLPEKVLIFSQFLEHIHVIEQQLTAAGIKFAGMYSPMHSSNKMKSLAIFQRDINCMALLMDGSAALGLDLSFVTHVFLMEPIWDRSMEEQVISRAHRMGATRPIHVETLAMRGTIEEQMLQFLQDGDECRRLLREEVGKADYEGARAHRTFHDFAESNYLARLNFVHTNPAS
ncbi:SNF2, N-terminal [Dillenia turbinata]|uniref:SNF2, N-terminal n=1 Tax=Dillenia turbinata TaxID=194707 RepID=A0AAN8ZGY5_9MAGN